MVDLNVIRCRYLEDKIVQHKFIQLNFGNNSRHALTLSRHGSFELNFLMDLTFRLLKLT